MGFSKAKCAGLKGENVQVKKEMEQIVKEGSSHMFSQISLQRNKGYSNFFCSRHVSPRIGLIFLIAVA